MAEINCSRCKKAAPQMDKPPMRGKIGLEIHASACQECWDEWGQGEVMIINEYRLSLADPEHRKVLYGHMRDFFGIAQPES
jgi:Fe-S cluster biosynthesis and repair protein YggX